MEHNENKPIGNPHLAAAMITLSDGIPRRFCWDLNAMIVFEQCGLITGKASFVRATLYAGLHRDAVDRGEGETWTLRHVGELVSAEMLESLIEQMDRLKKAAKVGPGESKASPRKKRGK